MGGAVADGGTDAQGSVSAGTPQTVTYTVTNSGTSDLVITTATTSVASNVTVNAVSAPASTTVADGGGSTTFTVQYTPTLAGAFSFALSFVNDDADENPFNFTVSGTATGVPEISVSSSVGGAVADGGTDAQGSVSAGTPQTVTYTVTNTGTDDLVITTATTSVASNVTINAVSAPASTTVAAGGGSTTFTVQYTPSVAGAFSFALSFVNDDADENPFNITVSGTASAAQFTVGGTVSGLAGTGLVLQNNGGDLAIATDGAFTFPTAIDDGSTYNVTVATQPSAPSQNCVVNNPTGTMSGADVSNVEVICTTGLSGVSLSSVGRLGQLILALLIGLTGAWFVSNRGQTLIK
ncbi:choice-of-anchor D domain-containing protein [Gilvimarinus sp. SDUM040013]|uniref:Choice-of-anchor D domain-containing protein n=1 Tax=Gilvimarinus gilvus TaxID=3058038 RepID=A0ABU4RYQ0_9GAMM|nr:choice-of-anchor D domain-containing protein [Gilvimarinus sp. SDUM040013]MDX6849296.1 choice-of-anchor D domain-containing protein [Gilvimarinus sp. SDUM040013]